MGDKTTAPLDLLRELREGFKAEAKHYRAVKQQAVVVNLGGKAAVAGAKAYAAEQVVRKIDATLRDWA